MTVNYDKVTVNSNLPAVDVALVSYPLNCDDLVGLRRRQTTTVDNVVLHFTQALLQLGQ